MENKPSAIYKEIVIGAKKEKGVPIPNTGETLTLYRFPLRRASLVFDLIVKHFGEALVTIGAKVYNSSAEKGAAKVKVDFSVSDLKAAVSSYSKRLEPGLTFQLFEEVILPDYVKAGGKSIILEEFYKRRGFAGLLEVFFAIIKFNFSDFLSSG